eukprot:CAMPEP_0197020388 /NCGR_PEP_ID=MMETSP1384-20130603/1155_1 /TAXON_ID=29189 /ORGANISM="Ammonia sp." /LENGTH=90 /DNA_ID=CAMNT_0042447999 /DNA_START=98 /DNA_END=370 /DNA_ORIENTATION=+
MASNSNNKNKNSNAEKPAEEKKEDKTAKIIEVVFNEDDAFEEFEMDTWKVDKNTQQQQTADLWQEDWGDKDVDQAFEILLRNEIQSAAKK